MENWISHSVRYVSCSSRSNGGSLSSAFLRRFRWVIITKYNNIKEVTGMSAAEAMKFTVSGGVAGFHSDDNVFKAPE